MITYWLGVLHLLGDYVTQSDWMAQKKTESSWPALAHALVYTVPFAILMPDWRALLFVAVTHFVIDRWRLARYVVWAKNFLAPRHLALGLLGTTSASRNHPWSECSTTGYHSSRPAWLAVWLLIAADNTMHLICNGLAWFWWGVA